MKYNVLILTACIAFLSIEFLSACGGEGFIVTPPPPVVITDSLILTIDSLVVSGHPNFTETLSEAYNFFGVDSVVMTFNMVSASDSNFARLVFSELNNFENRLIPFICGGIFGQCGGALVTFKFNPIWNDFSLWFWFNVAPNSTLKFKDIRIYKAR